MFENMALITVRYAETAKEYEKFLSRYNMDIVSVMFRDEFYELKMAIYADEETYLRLSFSDDRFSKEEEQITRLLDNIDELEVEVETYEENIFVLQDDDDDDIDDNDDDDYNVDYY